MDVLLVKPGMYPQAVKIGSELKDLQKAVSGDIDASAVLQVNGEALLCAFHRFAYQHFTLPRCFLFGKHGGLQ